MYLTLFVILYQKVLQRPSTSYTLYYYFSTTPTTAGSTVTFRATLTLFVIALQKSVALPFHLQLGLDKKRDAEKCCFARWY